MLNHEQEALTQCRRPNCCRKTHQTREQNALIELDITLTYRQLIDNKTRHARVFDLTRIRSVEDLGTAWRTTIPVNPNFVALQNSADVPPKTQEQIAKVLRNVQPKGSIRTEKIDSCPYGPNALMR